MSLPEVVSRDEWLTARKKLLAKEREHSRLREALSADRRRLPMVAVDKDYLFDGPSGLVALSDLFDGCRQLIVQHFMFDPGWDTGCPSCAALSDELSPGLLARLHAKGTAFAAVSLAPLAKITAFKTWNGWTFPWYSSSGSDFNYDFHATLDESVAPVMYNYEAKSEILSAGQAADDLIAAEQPVEVSGISCFLRDGGTIYHTYSAYADELDQASGARGFLALTALGG